MNKTWKPVTAGMLNIVGGALSLFAGIVAILRARRFERIIPHLGRDVVGLLWVILAIFAFAGGVAALQRKNWGMALAGSICAIFTPGFLLGVLATIFLAVSKNEFSAPNPG